MAHREEDHPEAINALTALDAGDTTGFRMRTSWLAQDLRIPPNDVRDALEGIFFLECVGMIPAKSKARRAA